MEIMEFDPSTIANSSITILLRGLKFTGDLTTEVSANKLTWIKNETIVEFGTDVPQFLKHAVQTIGDQSIVGVKTFSSLPVTTAGDATSANELVRKAQLDAAVLGSITNAPLIISGNAGETVAIDQLVYLDVADQEWKLCDADTAASVENVILGITRGAGTDGVAITNGVTVLGEHEAASAIFTTGAVFASNTAGGFSTSAGTKEVSLGIAKSTTKINFMPRYSQQITENQQDLVEQIEAGTDWYAASAVGTDAYAITITPAITAYTTGMKFRFKADVANTGACTLAVSGLSAIAIKKLNDHDTATGDIEAGQIVEVIYDGTNFQMQSQVAISTTTDIQTFTASDTWTKPSGAKIVEVYAIGGGGGGGSGRAISSAELSVTIAGGSGGGGGSYAFKRFDASGLGSTETVTIGSGGAGGASATEDSNGNDGSAGGNTTFGTTALLVAKGGSSGAGAVGTSAATGGSGGAVANGDITQAGGAGGGSNVNDVGDQGVDTAVLSSPRGGGAGGGAMGSQPSTKAGGVGGAFTIYYVKAGGAAGTIGNSSISLLIGGTGGGGGAGDANSSGDATAQAGGDGIDGSGGGGGGAAYSDEAAIVTSGAGGAGGDGVVIVITYF